MTMPFCERHQRVMKQVVRSQLFFICYFVKIINGGCYTTEHAEVGV